MIPSGKNANQQLNALVDAAREFFVTAPQLYFAQMRGKLSNLPQTNFEMGCDFAEAGSMRDAAMRFRIAVKLDPMFTQAWYNLGVCLMQLGDKEKATDALRQTLRLKPTHAEARYMLAVANPAAVKSDQVPTRMPRAMIDRFFSAAAPYYQQVETNNQYAAPGICEQKVMPHLATKTDLNIVDLGCGVGLASMIWRAKAASIIGVDVVPAMVQQAKAMQVMGKPLFDRVLQEDLYAAKEIAITPATIDVALLVNTAQFLGDLSGVMAGMSLWLKPGGIAAITVEPASGQALYGVHPSTSRFGHSAAYLQDMARNHGFTVVLQERVNLYPEMVAGIVILRKN